MNEITSYLTSLGLTPKEAKIFVTVYSLGSSPASTIARVAQTERVRTYKCLIKFADMGIIAHSIKSKVKHFWIPSLDLLRQYIHTQQNTRSELEWSFGQIQTLFQSYDQHRNTTVPKIQIYDDKYSIRHIYQDMRQQITEHHIIQIKLFATNTFETQIASHDQISKDSSEFFDNIAKHNIEIESYIAEWSLVMERLLHDAPLDTITNLPAGNNAINIYIIAQTVYIIIYKNPPIWLKIESPELAWAMHFLMEQTV